MRPRLALVPGEPGGIGPELCVRLAQRPAAADLIAYASPDTLLAAAAALHLPLRLCEAGQTAGPGELALHPVRRVRARQALPNERLQRHARAIRGRAQVP